MLTQINYSFPEFSIQVSHTQHTVVASKFIFATELELIVGKANNLSQQIISELDNYLANPNWRFILPVTLSGSSYQQRVWQAMQQIPTGSVLSYGELAKQLGSAPRAIGKACGSNPVPLLVPCHRIIAANQKLGGFTTSYQNLGLNIKKWLLNHEGVQIRS